MGAEYKFTQRIICTTSGVQNCHSIRDASQITITIMFIKILEILTKSFLGFVTFFKEKKIILEKIFNFRFNLKNINSFVLRK